MNKYICYILSLIILVSVLFTACNKYPFGPRVLTPDEEELKQITQYLVDASGCDDMKILSRGIDDSHDQVEIDVLGVIDIEHVDIIANAMNEYLEKNPQCFINKKGWGIQITFYYEKPKNLRSWDDCFARVGMTAHKKDEDNSEIYGEGINWIHIYISKEVPISVFAECKVSYKEISFSQAVTIDDIDKVKDLKSLKNIYLCEVNIFREEYGMKKLDYDSYINYCEEFNKVNDEKGYKFANIILSDFSKETWKEEYGDDFVTFDNY